MKTSSTKDFTLSVFETPWDQRARPPFARWLQILVATVSITCSCNLVPAHGASWEKSETLTRPLFNETRRPYQRRGLATDRVTPPASLSRKKRIGLNSSDLRLRGTVSGQYERLALIEHLPSGSMHKLRVGKTVIELHGGDRIGIETLSILHDRITILLDGNVILPLTPENSS